MTLKLLKENGFREKSSEFYTGGFENYISPGGVMSKTTWKNEVQQEST
jgi:hypothetical protein